MVEDQEESDRPTSVSELIALGRDREAVDVARRDSHDGSRSQGGGPLMKEDRLDGAQQIAKIIPLVEVLVDRIGPDQMDDPTPCAGFTVSGVLEHMIGGATAFAPAFRGEAAPSAPTPGAIGGTIQGRWRAAMADLVGASASPGALARDLASPFGEMPGATFARIVAFDGLVHGWDLATATNQPYAPPEDLVAEVDSFARELLKPEMRDGDTFAAETTPPAGASTLERLVAFSGRHLPV